jgi:UDP-glucose 4-epimerase
VIADFAHADSVRGALADAQAVLHLGAFMSWLPADADRVYAANATATWTLLLAAADARISRFVLASTGEVYPEVRPQYVPVDEDHPTQPISAYGLSKLVAEEMVAFFHRTRSLPFVICRLAHTQDARELLDPQSFFSGPRFYLGAKIRQQRQFGNVRALAALEPHDDGMPRHLVQCSEDGVPYRMMIADARDIADGIVLALDSPDALNATMNLGPDEAIGLDEAVALLAARTCLPIVAVRMPGPPVRYETSNARARGLLGFRPQYPFARMVEDAAAG